MTVCDRAEKELANFSRADTCLHADSEAASRSGANRFEGVASRSAYLMKNRLNERLEANAAADVGEA